MEIIAAVLICAGCYLAGAYTSIAVSKSKMHERDELAEKLIGFAARAAVENVELREKVGRYELGAQDEENHKKRE